MRVDRWLWEEERGDEEAPAVRTGLRFGIPSRIPLPVPGPFSPSVLTSEGHEGFLNNKHYVAFAWI